MSGKDKIQLSPPTFHGRQQKIQEILDLATHKNNGHSHVLLIEGPGGIGKSMLLRQAATLLQEEHPELRCVGPLDMDDTGYRVVANTGLSITNALGRRHFTRYIEAYRKYQGREVPQLDRSTVLIHLWRGNQSFIADYVDYAEDHRIVILVDTIESIRDTHVWSYFMRMMAQLPNTLFVLAGRPERQNGGGESASEALIARFRRMPLIGETGVTHIPLLGWPQREAYGFIQKTELETMLDETSKRCLLHLSRCHPLQLTLAVERLQEGRLPLLMQDDIIQQTPLYRAEQQSDEVPIDNTLPPDVDFHDLNEKGQSLVKQFERDLLLHHAGTEPLARVMRRMAHMRRRLNQEMYKEVIEFEPGIVGAPSWEEIQQKPWVRRRAERYVTLHDIVGEMIRQYIWPMRDPSGEQRRALSKQAVTLYDRQISRIEKIIADLDGQLNMQLQAINEQLDRKAESFEFIASDRFPELTELQQEIQEHERQLWVLEAERLYYQLDADLDRGYEQFLKKFDRAGVNQQLSVREMLLVEIEGYLDNFDVGSDAYYQVRVRQADISVDSNIIEKAAFILEELRRHYPAVERQYQLLQRLGNVYLRMRGRQEEGLEDLNKAMKLARSRTELQGRVGEASLELGWAYRQVGRWEDARDSYRDALNQTPLENQFLRAQIKNGLAYVEALIGEYPAAESFIKTALSYRRTHGTQRSVGISLSVQGEVYRYQEKYAEAHNAYDEAIALFSEIGDSGWLGLVQQEKAICLVQEDPKANLEDAHHYIENARYLCREFNARAFPSALNRAGRIYDLMRDYEEAFAAFEEGVEAAELAQDDWFMIANCVEYAELAFRLWHSTDIPDYRDRVFTFAEQIEGKEKEGYAFVDLFGRWHLVKGHYHWYQDVLASANGETAEGYWQKALEEYAKGFPYIAAGYYGSHGIRALPAEGKILRKRMQELPSDERLRWCNELQRIWGGQEQPVILLAIVADAYADLTASQTEDEQHEFTPTS